MSWYRSPFSGASTISQPIARSPYIAWDSDGLQPSAICPRIAQASASANPPPLFFPLLTVLQLSPMLTDHVRILFMHREITPAALFRIAAPILGDLRITPTPGRQKAPDGLHTVGSF